MVICHSYVSLPEDSSLNGGFHCGSISDLANDLANSCDFDADLLVECDFYIFVGFNWTSWGFLVIEWLLPW